MTNTLLVTADNLDIMKFAVLHIFGRTVKPICLMDIELRMERFEYQNELIETKVFSFLREIMQHEQAKAIKSCPAIFTENCFDKI